jgi:hypothetical protein
MTAGLISHAAKKVDFLQVIVVVRELRSRGTLFAFFAVSQRKSESVRQPHGRNAQK